MTAGRANRVAIARLVVANLSYALGLGQFYLLPKHFAEQGANPAQVGFFMAILVVAPLVLMPFCGMLVDRARRVPLLIGAYAAMAGLDLLLAHTESLGAGLALIRLGQGIAYTVEFTAANAIVLDLAPPDRVALTVGRFQMLKLLTHALGPLLGETIAVHYGYSTMIEVAAALSAVALVVCIGLREPKRVRAPSPPALRSLLRTIPMRPLWVLGLAGTTFGTTIYYLPLLAHERGLARTANFFVAYAFAAIFVRLVWGSLADRRDRRSVAALAIVAFGIAGATTAWVSAPWHLVALGIPFGIGYGLYYPALVALALDRMPSSARGWGVALTYVAANLGMSGGGFLFGLLANRTSLDTALLGAGGVGLVGAVVLVRESVISRAQCRHLEGSSHDTTASRSARSETSPAL